MGFILFLLLGFGGWAALVLNQDKRKQEEKRREQVEGQHLYNVFQKAMASGDKAAALKAGRADYGHQRGGTLTSYDEQALSNDLSTM